MTPHEDLGHAHEDEKTRPSKGQSKIGLEKKLFLI
jgi:hypothetical protein